MKNVAKVLTIVLSASALGAVAGEQVKYPEQYRDWTHVKSMVIEPGHPLENPFKGIHHIYANESAKDGYASGKFADGSVIVFDLLDYNHSGKTLTESSRKLIGVMEKNDKKFAQTGGWGFEAFSGDTEERIVSDGGVSCFGCHASQKSADFVFSKARP